MMFASYHNLPCPFAEWLPIIITIDSLNGKTSRQEEQLQLARKEDMHIELGQVTFVIARLKKLLMRPYNMLQLFKGIILAATIQ